MTNKQITPITLAQINKFKTDNPNDKTDFSLVIAVIQNGLPYDCPCCSVQGIGTGITNNTECHICDGTGKVKELGKVIKTVTFSKGK